jgi:ABC-type Na+ efflux pump permease subunit
MRVLTALPIVERELRAAARQPATYRVRWLSALLPMLGVGWSFFASARLGSPAFWAQMVFNGLVWWLFAACVLAGTKNTADCLSEEKRAGTLGLLFLTDLKSRDIVLGKLASTSVRMVYGVLGALPVLAVPMFAGGVTFGDFFFAALVALNALFFSLATGMFVSAISWHERRAMSATFFIIMAFCGYPALIIANAAANQLPFPPMDPWFWVAPWYPLLHTHVAVNRFASEVYWVPLLMTHALGWLFFGSAIFILPRSWQDKSTTTRSERWRERWAVWSRGSGAQRLRWRRRILDRNPFLWLAGSDRLQNALVWVMLAVTAVTWLAGMLNLPDGDRTPLLIIPPILLHSALKLWCAAQAGQRLAQDRLNGALELILSTPLPVRDIIRGQWAALRRQFFWPTLAVLLADMFLYSAGAAGRWNSSPSDGWTPMFVNGMVVFVADMITLGWLGMWLGLTVRRPSMVAGTAGFRVLVVPWLGFILTLNIVVIFSRQRQEPSSAFLCNTWLTLSLLNDAFWIWWARRQLRTQFRVRATESYQPRSTRPRFWAPWRPAAPPQSPSRAATSA